MPIFSIPQGPDYMGAGRQIAAMIGAEAKPWDIAEHVATIRTMAEKLAEDQQMFPIKLATAQMQSRMIQDEVRSYEIEHSPERVRAAADLKMQEDQLRVEGMFDVRDQRIADKEFKDKYLPALSIARASNDPVAFAKAQMAALNSPNGGRFASHVEKERAGFSAEKLLAVDTRMAEQKIEAMDAMDEILRMQDQMLTAEGKQARASVEAMNERATFGKSISEFSTEEDVSGALRTLLKKGVNKDNPVMQLLGKEVDQPGFLEKAYGSGQDWNKAFATVPGLFIPGSQSLLGPIQEKIGRFILGPDAIDPIVSEAAATKMELMGYMKIIKEATDPAVKERAQDALRFKLENIGEAHLVRRLAAEGKTEALAAIDLKNAKRLLALQAKMGQAITPLQERELRIKEMRATRGGASGYRKTYENDAMGKRISETKTPLGGGAGGSDFATMEEATAAGNAGQIPANTTVTIGGKPMIWRP